MGESKSFIDSIWRKLKQDSQYELEEVYDWTSHPEHLQSILMQVDSAAAPTESTIIRYFEEGLKPSIKAKMDQDATHLDDYEELVAKAVTTKTKAGLQPSFYLQETDIQVLQRSRPAHITTYKVQTQGVMNHRHKSRGKGSTYTPASASTQDPEPSDKAKKIKKKKQHRDKMDSRESRDTSVSRVNATEIGDKKRKRKNKDPREVIYYNYNKLGYYADQCPEPWEPKNLYWSWRSPRQWLVLEKRLWNEKKL